MTTPSPDVQFTADPIASISSQLAVGREEGVDFSGDGDLRGTSNGGGQFEVMAGRGSTGKSTATTFGEYSSENDKVGNSFS